MSDDDRPARPRISLRVNGARVGDAARPTLDGAASGYRIGGRRPMLRVNGSTRPGLGASRIATDPPDHDDDGIAS
jgi:hypothetical protein